VIPVGGREFQVEGPDVGEAEEVCSIFIGGRSGRVGEPPDATDDATPTQEFHNEEDRAGDELVSGDAAGAVRPVPGSESGLGIKEKRRLAGRRGERR